MLRSLKRLSACLCAWFIFAADKSVLADPAHANAFANPTAQNRVAFRYWLPDASVDTRVVAHDVEENARVGAGGFEFVPFFEYGGALGTMPRGADWSEHGFGTEAYRKLLVAALVAHRDQGLLMDIALGPNQGQGVPAKPTSEGLQWDLVCETLI